MWSLDPHFDTTTQAQDPAHRDVSNAGDKVQPDACAGAGDQGTQKESEEPPNIVEQMNDQSALGDDTSAKKTIFEPAKPTTTTTTPDEKPDKTPMFTKPDDEDLSTIAKPPWKQMNQSLLVISTWNAYANHFTMSWLVFFPQDNQ